MGNSKIKAGLGLHLDLGDIIDPDHLFAFLAFNLSWHLVAFLFLNLCK